MSSKKISQGLTVLLTILTVVLLVTSASAAATARVLHGFKNNGIDGADPQAGLIFDAAGNLYGTTFGGGAYGVGTVFELTPVADGGWTETVLHDFQNNGVDGVQPQASLILDAAGNLYGTTGSGGTYYSGGTVFELMHESGGGWTEKILHNFNGTDGQNPCSSLLFDTAGNLYGTTQQGGAYSYGAVFELTPKADGSWKETALHNFNRNGRDGYEPLAGLVSDAAGNLYGTTGLGGSHDGGIVFELISTTTGVWTERILRSFNGTDGAVPSGNLILDAAGDLYGTTEGGGHNDGIVFELTPKTGGGWEETVLFRFTKGRAGGRTPLGGLVFDAAGRLYGTTIDRGLDDGGTLFELGRSAGGWEEGILHQFDGRLKVGDEPYAGVIVDAAGNLYGTTSGGGPHGGGAVFEIVP
jgi:uncharacterized repeat protein (TIGR03803 family)